VPPDALTGVDGGAPAPPATGAPGPDDRLTGLPAGGRPGRRFGWVLRPAVIYVLSRVVTVGTIAVCSPLSGVSMSGEIDRWDSRWFLRAAVDGWPRHIPPGAGPAVRSTIAFFPVFPLTIRWLSDLTGLSPLTCGLVVGWTSGLTAMIGVWALVRHYADPAAADRATLLVAVFPGSFILSLVYAEGMAVTFVAFGLLALMRRRWVTAGVLGLLATATTPIALAFVVSCAWCAYREVSRHRDWRSLAAPVLSPLGFVAFQVWLWRHTGSLLAWRLTERNGWDSYPSIAYPVHLVVVFVRDPVATTITGDVLFVGIVAAVFGVVVAVRTRLPLPLLLYAVAAVTLGLVSAPVGLRPRFVFLAFPLIIAVGTWLRGRPYVIVVSVSVVLLAAVTAYSVTSWAVFP